MDKNNNKKGKEKLLLWRGIVDFTNLLFWEELDAVFLLIDKVQNSPLKFRWMDLRFSWGKKKRFFCINGYKKRKIKDKKLKGESNIKIAMSSLTAGPCSLWYPMLHVTIAQGSISRNKQLPNKKEGLWAVSTMGLCMK